MKKIISLLITAIFAFLYYYITLPAINFQAEEFYVFLLLILLVYVTLEIALNSPKILTDTSGYFRYIKHHAKIPFFIALALIIVLFAGPILSWELFRASDYKNLLTVTEGNFTEDITEISYQQIPTLDRDSASILGDRKLGELSDMVSQFEVANNYTQINYQGRPVRVTPLSYGDVIKWFTNQKNGIPAYIILDMVTQEVEVVRLENGIKYSQSEIFNRKLERYIRFNYPTFMFDEATFEIDENGTPYWICPKIVKKIGIFGGTDIEGAVLVNAITGETAYYKDVPSWVDRVYNSNLILQQYDYHGAFVNGFWNSMFGQRDVTETTLGSNYIALNDDVYLYTGITSVGGDQSNIGFILSNQRTKETKFYPVAGATENSAMNSAKGIVQHLNYTATFPLLLNVSSQPTYFIALKDNAQLVKMYAMVNVGQYQIVATGTTVEECEAEYIRLIKQKNIITDDVSQNTTLTGTITEIRTAVKEGNTYYYLKLSTSENYYSISATQYEPVVTFNVGDIVSLEYLPSTTNIYTIYQINKVPQSL